MTGGGRGEVPPGDWLKLAAAAALLLLFVFGVLPLARKLPWVGTMMDHNAQSGIHAPGLFYTEVEQTFEHARSLGEDGDNNGGQRAAPVRMNGRR